MALGTDNLQYGEGFGGTSQDFGSSIYDQYRGEAIASSKVDVDDYLYTYDPLKEQNLLAEYMSSLVDMGDKTDAVRTKAIEERKALSKSVSGGLSTGTMVDTDEQNIEDAKDAVSGIYRDQFSSKRRLGEDIGSLREAYEADLAESVLDYNEQVGGDGSTYSELEQFPIENVITDYADNYNVSDPKGSKKHAIAKGNPSGDYAISNSTSPDYKTSGDDNHKDTWLNKSTGAWYKYSDPKGFWGTGEWKHKGNWRDKM